MAEFKETQGAVFVVNFKFLLLLRDPSTHGLKRSMEEIPKKKQQHRYWQEVCDLYTPQWVCLYLMSLSEEVRFKASDKERKSGRMLKYKTISYYISMLNR